MLAARYVPVVLKQVLRHRTRSVLTVAGVSVAMFLYCAIHALQSGADAATRRSAADSELIVFRKDRYCASTSRLPESHGDRIARVAGVEHVLPVQVVVSNCRAGLDVVTFRGVPDERFLEKVGSAVRLASGSIDGWRTRLDAVLIGEALAHRRGLRAGQTFESAGITVYVAGVLASDEPQHRNVAYAHLPFLQRAVRDGLGIVTQFSVRVGDPQQIDSIARMIDAEFATDASPTSTHPEKAFVARAAADVLEIVRFTRWLGWGCLAAVLALVGNAIVLAVQDRIREHAILQTLGFGGGLVSRLILAESLILSLAGGAVGSAVALVAMGGAALNLSVEGMSIPITADVATLISGVCVSAVLGVVAGLFPAWQAGRRDIVECLRAV